MGAETSTQYPRGLSGLFTGVKSVLAGLARMSKDRELRKLALLPVLITGVLYLAMLAVAIFFTDDLLGLVLSQPESGFWHYAWYALLVIAFVLILVVLGLLFITIASALAGPFYEKMATKILASYQIKTVESGFVDGVVSSIVRLAVFALPSGLCLLLGLIPYIGPVFFGIGTLIAWMGLAAEANEPALMATEHKLGERMSFLGRSFATMVGIGGVMGLSLLLPFAPLVAIPSAVVGVSELYARTVSSQREVAEVEKRE